MESIWETAGWWELNEFINCLDWLLVLGAGSMTNRSCFLFSLALSLHPQESGHSLLARRGL